MVGDPPFPGALWVEYPEGSGKRWPTYGGRWAYCPKCDRQLSYREFMFGSYGLCSWCRPDLLEPYVRPKSKPKAKQGEPGIRREPARGDLV